VELEAANRERERLARGIHDSVLQVLAMVQRRGAKLDGEAGELARLAGQQEAALRALIATGPVAAGDGVVDLRTVLNVYAGPAVSVAVPAVPVPLPARVAREVGAAVGAALANVERHCGPAARAWVLVEDEAGLRADDPAELVADDAAGLRADEAAGHRGGVVTVTVRDDGPGIPGERLGEAAAEGRLGVAQSIRGRIADLGGTARITSAPGEGTEIELRIPRGLR
ncbi:MAG TPA: ATP-binding protein, partial [Pilimelia sp.]|nr:ATP-binding protein [Pilimelia sp.]